MWSGCSRQFPGRFTSAKEIFYPSYRSPGGAPRTLWTGGQHFTLSGIWSSDRPARSESLYRLHSNELLRRQNNNSNWQKMRYIERISVGALKEYFWAIRNVTLDHRLYNNSSPVSLSIAFLMPDGGGEAWARGECGEADLYLILRM